ncbi:protein-L-isoaspartate(D-aspartate) O-methyltransferase [Thiospirillum jenense]|uniref:Protein-L-isoaspartate O-methyltransferase n=2 Tax=Thiospirillum jenense TaxID=1653858 RepID=A0A839HEH6_9GAMM|nr:protein-L-isoaspartate(D-aspartate) O-methyltransferase [Thiospirillum jenense]MBB1125796.1 protein-L-isoaspartate(D-aspartate) O-methyltransferase [Thiospirillum jenense]
MLRQQQRLVEQLRTAGIQDQRVLAVMGQVPRHQFVDEALANRAYEASALPIGYGQTISHPYTVACMTAALLENQSHAPARLRVLEIGTGSGFQTAVLAALVARVYSIERLALLATRAAQRLQQLKLRNVRLQHGDGNHGWPDYAPFDGIVVTAAAKGIPRPLAQQLTIGGCMVTPLDTGQEQVLIRLTRTTAEEFCHELLGPATFVPLLSGVAFGVSP